MTHFFASLSLSLSFYCALSHLIAGRTGPGTWGVKSECWCQLFVQLGKKMTLLSLFLLLPSLFFIFFILFFTATRGRERERERERASSTGKKTRPGHTCKDHLGRYILLIPHGLSLLLSPLFVSSTGQPFKQQLHFLLLVQVTHGSSVFFLPSITQNRCKIQFTGQLYRQKF